MSDMQHAVVYLPGTTIAALLKAAQEDAEETTTDSSIDILSNKRKDQKFWDFLTVLKRKM